MDEEKKVYVGNLEYGVTEDDLKKLLEEKGIVAQDVKIIQDNYSGRSKGFGFAEFETSELAQKAIDALNGHELNGRALNVNKAKKTQPKRDNFGGGYNSGRFDR